MMRAATVYPLSTMPITSFVVPKVSLRYSAVSYTHLDVYKRQVPASAVPAVRGQNGIADRQLGML